MAGISTPVAEDKFRPCGPGWKEVVSLIPADDVDDACSWDLRAVFWSSLMAFRLANTVSRMARSSCNVCGDISASLPGELPLISFVNLLEGEGRVTSVFRILYRDAKPSA